MRPAISSAILCCSEASTRHSLYSPPPPDTPNQMTRELLVLRVVHKSPSGYSHAASCASPSLVDWKRTIRRAIAKFVVLLLVSSIALPATAFRGSHSTGRSHSRSSSHRATASSIQRNRHGRIRRSAAAKHSFERQHPCPSTGRTSGRCPGYVVDHVNPLECDGADAPSNMQWQTVAVGKAKDKTEGRCR